MTIPAIEPRSRFSSSVLGPLFRKANAEVKTAHPRPTNTSIATVIISEADFIVHAPHVLNSSCRLLLEPDHSCLHERHKPCLRAIDRHYFSRAHRQGATWPDDMPGSKKTSASRRCRKVN